MASLRRPIVIVISCLLLIAAGATIFLYAMVAGFRNADARVSPALDTFFAAIANGTTASHYESSMSRQFKSGMPLERWEGIGDNLNHYFGKPRAKRLRSFVTSTTGETQASYLVDFENIRGVVTAKVIKEDGDWKIAGLEVIAQCPSCGAMTPNENGCPVCGKKPFPNLK